MSSKPVLYSYWRSSCSWRVRAALSLLSVDYDCAAVNLLKEEQRAAAYLRLNPAGTVPTLVIPGAVIEVGGRAPADLVLFDSIAIMHYLHEAYGNESVGLLPKSPVDKAMVLQICNMIACGIQPVQNMKVLQKVGGDEKMSWGKHWIEQGFDALESVLSSTSGAYSYGDSVTMADCCLVPQVYNAARFAVPLERYPTIGRVHSALAALPAFQASHPDKQPDRPQPSDH